MIEFRAEIRQRIRVAMDSLACARRAGDDYLAEVRTGELESLVRLARDHGLRVPEVEPLLGWGPSSS